MIAARLALGPFPAHVNGLYIKAGSGNSAEERAVELKDLLDLHEKLETRINAYWTYWSVAILAMGGWLFTSGRGLSHGQEIALAIGAAVFFLANLGVLWSATRLVTGVRDEIRMKSKAATFGSPRLAAAFAQDDMAFRLQLTLVLHLAIDAVVLWAILAR